MQLLLARGQHKDKFGRPVFDLVAKFELTNYENDLIRKYGSRDFILAEGDPQRDLLRAVKYTVVIAVVIGIFFFVKIDIVAGLFFGLVALAGGSYGLYHYLREEIRVGDMLAGRSFACRSVVTLMAKENSITEMA